MPTTTTPDRIRDALRRGLGDVIVSTARPDRLFQIEIPAYALDGDGLQVYVEPHARGFHVTDMGATFMRASYAGELTDAQHNEVAELVLSQGLAVDDGALGAIVGESELFAAVMGLVQAQVTVETAVWRAHAPKRARAEEDFRALVAELLRNTFHDAVTFDYADESDPDGDFAIDAFVGGTRPIGVAIVPNNFAAERAVGSKLQLAHASDRYASVEWLSIPRDVAALTKRTRRRLDHAFEPLVTAYDASESAVVAERLLRRVA